MRVPKRTLVPVEGVRVLKRTLALSGERWVLLGSSVGWGGS